MFSKYGCTYTVISVTAFILKSFFQWLDHTKSGFMCETLNTDEFSATPR